ncbi:MAG: GSCFA domain-containing protein [Prevotella sp.]|nr:GSCFA domain-containing protein [Prevotella sp.]
MLFRTVVEVPRPDFELLPLEPLLFVGSCFADSIGRRFAEEKFPVVANPYGVMYNPASILHTAERLDSCGRVAFVTLGTNHVYRLKATGEIVDNCQKRPQRLFEEEALSVDECCGYLRQTVAVLRRLNAEVRVVLTVSPIRYAKYGYHGSQLSKATLLLAADRVAAEDADVYYFPAYEIVCDELRDYRFYQPDMLHPSEQTVEYIWQRLVGSYFSDAARQYLEEWRPLKEALAHKPFHPESEEYRSFLDKTMLKVAELSKKYPTFAL